MFKTNFSEDEAGKKTGRVVRAAPTMAIPQVRPGGCQKAVYFSYPLYGHSVQALDAQVILFHKGVLAQFLRRQGFTVFLLCHGANLVQFSCA